MTTKARERVAQWSTRPFSGGYRGLHDLADEEFSGVVEGTAGTLCMLNGTVIGVLDGSIEDFESADGTAYRAPSPALALLIVMQERSEDVRAKYYTEDTALSKVDSTLSDGGFTGYVELSENVLSGDYYVVYHGGRSMSVAFVGESEQLHTDEDAFERANDEVGIYEVRPVDIEPVEIPDPPEPVEESAPAGGATAQSAAEETATEPMEGTTATDRSEPPTTEAAPSATGDANAGGRATDEDGEDTDADEAVVDDSNTDEVAVSDTDESPDSTESATTAESTQERGEDESERAARDASDESETSEQLPDPEHDDESTRDDDDRNGDTTEKETITDAQPANRTRSPDAIEDTSGTDRDDPVRSEKTTAGSHVATNRRQTRESGRQEREVSTPDSGTSTRRVSGSGPADLEIKAVPSLAPERTGNGREERQPTASGPTPTSQERSPMQPAGVANDPQPAVRSTEAASEPTGKSTDRQPTEPETEPKGDRKAGTDEDRVAELEETIANREERIEVLEDDLEAAHQQRDELRAERDELQAELESVREELSDLRAEREALESKLDEIDGTDGATPDRRLTDGEAMDGTDLFVRYRSKGAPTLKSAYDGAASKDDVNDNLNLESHTQFERDGTNVAGEPFEAFLEGTIEYQFVAWVVRELLFEIRDTNHQDALADLYDAVPRIDRAEFNGTTTVEYTEDGQTNRSQETFDVVLRDRMGNPLVVANVNDTRQAATEDQMSSLVTAATRVAESNASLAGAMFVTASFFKRDALKTADDATGGGLLSRDKRESFVKTSRKQGYHLCLIEARDDQFHMAVPEL